MVTRRSELPVAVLATEDKIGRRGIRLMDLVDPVVFSRKLRENLEEKNAILERLGEEPLNYNEIYRAYQDHADVLKVHGRYGVGAGQVPQGWQEAVV